MSSTGTSTILYGGGRGSRVIEECDSVFTPARTRRSSSCTVHATQSSVHSEPPDCRTGGDARWLSRSPGLPTDVRREVLDRLYRNGRWLTCHLSPLISRGSTRTLHSTTFTFVLSSASRPTAARASPLSRLDSRCARATFPSSARVMGNIFKLTWLVTAPTGCHIRRRCT